MFTVGTNLVQQQFLLCMYEYSVVFIHNLNLIFILILS